MHKNTTDKQTKEKEYLSILTTHDHLDIIISTWLMICYFVTNNRTLTANLQYIKIFSFDF